MPALFIGAVVIAREHPAASPSFGSPIISTIPAGQYGISDGYPIDFDSDGDSDLIVAPSTPQTYPATSGPLRAFRNNGSGAFAEVTAEVLGSISVVNVRDFRSADLNGDGRVDLFVADHGTDVSPFPGAQSRILIQSKDGKLVDETATRLPIIDAFTHHVSLGDIDSDGDLDVYMCNISILAGPRFYINDGTGVFAAATNRLPASISDLTRIFTASLFVDVELDGDLDLVLGESDLSMNESTRDTVLVNDGTGFFTGAPDDTLPLRYGGANWQTVAIASGDFNADGWPDLLMSVNLGYTQPFIQLLLNSGDGTFSDATVNVPQSWPAGSNWIKWIRPADLDHDGLLDFVCSAVGGVPKLFMNLGQGVFADQSVHLPPIPARMVFAHEFTGDDRPDVYVLSQPVGHVVLPNIAAATGLLQNGDFSAGVGEDSFPAGWNRFSLPGPDDIMWDVATETLRFQRPPGSSQAVVFQQTHVQVPANATLQATFTMANSDPSRKRFSVLIHDLNFSDLHVCTFWLPGNAPARTFAVRTHTTRHWNNATISFYAATMGSGGFYELDDVRLRVMPGLSPNATVCVDPQAHDVAGGFTSNLLSNSGFDAGLSPWVTFGMIASQLTSGVFEFHKLPGSPAGVVLQGSGQAVASKQALRLSLRLGNNSAVRQRVTVLVHKEDFMDLHACTFWLSAGTPLRTFSMRTYSTIPWNNAFVSIYPSTAGSGPAFQWLTIDDVALAGIDGLVQETSCLEPGEAVNSVR